MNGAHLKINLAQVKNQNLEFKIDHRYVFIGTIQNC